MMKYMKVISTIIYLILLLILLLFFSIEAVIVSGIDKNIYYIYLANILILLLSYALLMFKKIRKITIIICIISFSVFLTMRNFNLDIVNEHQLNKCLDNGFSFNYNTKECE